MNRLLTVSIALLCCLPLAAAQTDSASHIASLIDPAKLATLGKRGANTRVQKAVYWLAAAPEGGREARQGARPGGYPHQVKAVVAIAPSSVVFPGPPTGVLDALRG